VVRRKWLIVVPFVVGAAGAGIVLHLRLQFDLMGAAGGLAIGLLLAGLLEYRDASFKCQQDVVRVLSLPVLALIPVVSSSAERQARQRVAVTVGVALAVFLIGAAAIALWRL